jgi:hypothetical protein
LKPASRARRYCRSWGHPEPRFHTGNAGCGGGVAVAERLTHSTRSCCARAVVAR